MGADMLIYSVFFRKDLKPDWDAGKEFIRAGVREWSRKNKMPEDMSYRFDEPSQAGERLESALDAFKEAFEGKRRDADRLSVGGTEIIQTGGMSWGDAPTELYDDIRDLYSMDGLLEACGFNPPALDWESIVQKILDIKPILPLLIGLDRNLDGLIALKLKKTAYRARRTEPSPA